MKDEVTISRAEYNHLQVLVARLGQLEINGVDNWGQYGCMCSDYTEEDECIFCTEDENEFLGLKEN